MEILSVSFFETTVFTWVVLPLLIFLSRIADQSIGTLRLIFLAKGYKYIAPALGFFEVIIWLLAVSQIIQHLSNIMCYVAYGAGFAAGNFLGMMIDEKLSLGNVIIRVIPKMDTSTLIEHLKSVNYGLTVVDAMGSKGEVKVIFSIIKRKDVTDFISIINKHNPNAFYTIEEVKCVHEGIRHTAGHRGLFDSLSFKLKKIK